MRIRFISAALAAFFLVFTSAGLAADKSSEERAEKRAEKRAERRAEKRADTKADDTRLSRADRKFIDKALADGRTEVELGKLAEQNGSSDAVKQFGKRMVADHSKAGDELQAIASKLGYTPSNKAMQAHQGDVKKFSKMKADKFDREYSKHMVKDHEKAVNLFKKEAQDGQAQEVWQFATKTLPTLEEHLRMARDMSGDKGGDRRGRKKDG